MLACDEAVNAALGALPGDVSVRRASFSFGACGPFMLCPPSSDQPNFGKVVFETNDPAMRLVWVVITGRDLQGRGGPLRADYQGEWLVDCCPADID